MFCNHRKLWVSPHLIMFGNLFLCFCFFVFETCLHKSLYKHVFFSHPIFLFRFILFAIIFLFFFSLSLSLSLPKGKARFKWRRGDPRATRRQWQRIAFSLSATQNGFFFYFFVFFRVYRIMNVVDCCVVGWVVILVFQAIVVWIYGQQGVGRGGDGIFLGFLVVDGL